MKQAIITAVGIDVSKGKSTVAVRRPGGEILLAPFCVNHNAPELSKLVDTLRRINGDMRIVMEHTGIYWRPVAHTLKRAGFFVSVVNAMLIHDFSNNSLRKVKTDNADALKIANYGLTFWSDLSDYSIEEETRQMLKAHTRLYERILTTSVSLKNNLISLLDQTFPNADKLFYPDRRSAAKGRLKWVDFSKRFWHMDCVAGISLNAFCEIYRKWCHREGYRFNMTAAEKIHCCARNGVATLPKCESTKILITQAVDSLKAVVDAMQALRTEMLRLAALLPEFEIVMSLNGAGPITGPQLMAEIGDVRRFTHKGALVAFAGVDAPPFQSGVFDSKSRHVSKRGSPHLRRTLFQISSIILQLSNPDDPVFQFMDRKRAEGKHFYVYIVAGAAKFLRIYYARVKEYLAAMDKKNAAVA